MSIINNNNALNKILSMINDLPNIDDVGGSIVYTNIVYNDDNTITLTDKDGVDHTMICEYVEGVLSSLTYDGKSIELTYEEDTLVGVGATEVDMENAPCEESGGHGQSEAKGIIWVEVDDEGYPIKVDASAVRKTESLFRYGDYVRTKEIVLPENRPIDTYFMCYHNLALEKINMPTKAENMYSGGQYVIRSNCFIGCKSLTLSDWQIPDGVTRIDGSSFEAAESLTDRIIPASVTEIHGKAFNRCYSMKKVVFLGTPNTIADTAFANCTNLKDIYVPWAEGEVENAPFGATSATIHYNTQYDENGNPIVAEV